MTSTSKHGKANVKSARQAAFAPEKMSPEELSATGLLNPLILAMATGTVRPVPPRGRPRDPEKAKRDALIVQMRNKQKYSFGEIALKLKIPQPVVKSAYYRQVELNSR